METKDYQEREVKFCSVSFEYSGILNIYKETQEAKINLFNPAHSPQRRAEIEGWIKTEGEPYLVTGVYCWPIAFNSNLNNCWLKPHEIKDYEEFDIIHVNMYGLTQGFPSILGEIREKIGWKSKTKIVANLDYAVELWVRNNEFLKVDQLIRDLDQADMVFCTSKIQMDNVQFLFEKRGSKRKVFHIPHPTMVHELKTLYTEPEQRLRRNKHEKPVVLVNVHRWDFNILPPSLALRPSFLSPLDYTNYVNNINEGNIDEVNRARLLYHNFFGAKPFSRFMEWCSMLYACVDSYTLSSYGRCNTEFGALGVPTIGNPIIESQARIFPDLCCGPFDIPRMHELLHTLRYDEKFYKEVVEKALKMSEFYGLENSRKRFLDALYGDKQEEY